MRPRTSIPATFLLVAVLVSVFILTGCGGGEAQSPQEALTAAVSAAREAGSAHAQMNVSISPLEGESGMGLNVQGDAWLDMDARSLEARFTVMGFELSLRYVEDTAYVQFGGTWYELQPDALGVGEGTIGAVFRVLAATPDIISSAAEVNELGDKKVGNYECTNLEVTPDLEAVANLEPVQQLAAELDMEMDEMVQYLQDADIVMQVCVQKDEPVVRQAFIAATVELPSIGDVFGIALLPEIARVEMTVDFPEYGMEVDVQAPADAEPFEGF